MPTAKKFKCKLCNADMEERDGLPGLRVCQLCDDLGRSGVAERAHITFSMKGKEKRSVVYQAPGE